jgi:hypothetical protein
MWVILLAISRIYLFPPSQWLLIENYSSWVLVCCYPHCNVLVYKYVPCILFSNQAADIIAVSTSLLDSLPADTSPTESKCVCHRIIRTFGLSVSQFTILLICVFYVSLFWYYSVLFEVIVSCVGATCKCSSVYMKHSFCDEHVWIIHITGQILYKKSWNQL